MQPQEKLRLHRTNLKGTTKQFAFNARTLTTPFSRTTGRSSSYRTVGSQKLIWLQAVVGLQSLKSIMIFSTSPLIIRLSAFDTIGQAWRVLKICLYLRSLTALLKWANSSSSLRKMALRRFWRQTLIKPFQLLVLQISGLTQSNMVEHLPFTSETSNFTEVPPKRMISSWTSSSLDVV